MEQGEQTSSNNLEVISMIIWLSTGNGKFFELVGTITSILSIQFISVFLSTALVIPLNKSYLNHPRVHFVGDITILLLILTVNPILKYSKLFSNLVFVSKVHQVLVHKVFFVLNTSLSNAIKHISICSILTGFIVLRNLFVFTFI